jgi:hypothetical protein
MANLWTVSLDDSGDEKKADFILAGCLIGDKSEWNGFQKTWRKCLHSTPRIEYFHQKESGSLSGEFYQFKDKVKWPCPEGSRAANSKRTSLLRVIAESDLKCYAMAIRVPDYDRVRMSSEKAQRFLDKDPWAYLVQELAYDTAKHIVRVDPKATIAFIGGPHEKKLQYEKFYDGFREKNPVIAEHMLSMTHGNYKKIYSLQAADLIASEAKKCFESANRKETEQNIFNMHPILGQFVAFQTITEDHLKDIVRVQGTIPKSK